jgi:hypothetical protein
MTFKEYVQGKLTCFSSGVLLAMKSQFSFLNIAGIGMAFHNITDMAIEVEYNTLVTVRK